MKIFLMLFVLALPLSVSAREKPCEKDRETYCANVEPGEGKMMKCMEEHADQLSAECKAFRAQAKEGMKEVVAACQGDAEKLCAGKKKKALIRCLRQNRSQLSEGCKSEIKEMKAMREEKK